MRGLQNILVFPIQALRGTKAALPPKLRHFSFVRALVLEAVATSVLLEGKNMKLAEAWTGLLREVDLAWLHDRICCLR